MHQSRLLLESFGSVIIAAWALACLLIVEEVCQEGHTAREFFEADLSVSCRPPHGFAKVR